MARLLIRPIPHEATRPLRGKILRPGQPPSSLFFPGDDGRDAFHLGGFLTEAEGEPVAVASLYKEPPPGEVSASAMKAWRLRGMAVDAPLQGTGLGGQLLDACLDHLRERGASFIWCNARVHAAGFYLSRGFVQDEGDAFDIPGVGPHYQMRRPLR